MAMTDRSYFEAVAAAAFSNPFSEERRAGDLKLAGLKSDQPDRLDRVLASLAERLRKLAAHGRADIRQFDGAERDVMVIVFLFDAFHVAANAFDQHILQQERAGEMCLPLPFARQTLDLLARRGFSAEGARHFFAVFFQMRRAFHFISRGLAGDSAAMKELRRRLWSNLFTHDIQWYERFLWDRMEDYSTMLLGETGTGKGSAAAALGRSGFIPFDERSGRFTESFVSGFVAINLSQFPASLIESELFGHKKGAFTGAINDHEGVFARCRPHGSIFLDEIGDVPRAIQIKLLRVLQERTFQPVGSHETLKFRGRVIAATHQSLDELRQRGEMRDDFYYRLCSDVITLPSLRQRLREDPRELELLLGQIMPRLAGRDSPDLIKKIRASLAKHPGPAYTWPGNVRELEQAARRIMLTQHYDGDIHPQSALPASRLAAAFDAGSLTAGQLLSAYCSLLHDRLGTYEAVADRTQLDRRTVKKYIEANVRPSSQRS